MKRWIYQLNKEEAVREAENRGLDPTGTLDDLRARLSRHVTELVTMLPLGRTDSTASLAPSAGKPPAPMPPAPTHTDDAQSHAKCMNQIRKWGCHFDGRDPLSFLERVEELQLQYRYTDELMLAGLPELLRGDATAWYRNNRTDWSTWTDFTTALRRQYLPRRYQAKLTREVQDRRQKTDEPFNKYATDLLTMMRRAGHYTTAEKVDRIYENMWTEYKFFVRLNDQTDLADLMEQAAEYEDLKKAQGQEARTEKRAVGTAATASVAYDRRTCCWRCKQRGHHRMNCRQPAKKFCSQCGKDGVFSKDCHPVPGNAAVAGDNATLRPDSTQK